MSEDNKVYPIVNQPGYYSELQISDLSDYYKVTRYDKLIDFYTL